jgi:tetratricopeptide (TPR) repeat protein
VADTRIDELRRRLERDPGSRLFAQLAEELRKGGDLVEAIRVARAGLTVHPSYPSARLTLGRALLDSGDAAGGRVELESALRDAPDNILASRFLAQAKEALGDVKGAVEQYQKTLLMAPGDRAVQGQLQAAEAKLRAGSPASSGIGGETKPPVSRSATAPSTPAAPGGLAAKPAAVAAPAAAPVVFAPSRPLAPAAPESHSEEFDTPGALAPTVRLRTSQPEALPPAPAAAPPPPVPAARPAVAPTAASEAPTMALGPSVNETARMPAGEFLAGTAAPGTVQHTWFAPSAPEPRAEAPLPPTLVDSAHAASTSGGTLPATPASAPAPEGPVSHEAPKRAPAAAGPGSDLDPDASTPFSSSTLAELYFQQGLVERAVDVYRQLIQQDPSNEKARLRLVELESASAGPEDRAARRKALERTIAGLENLLAAVQRR